MATWKQEASFQLLFSSELYLYLRTVDINILTYLVFAKLVTVFRTGYYSKNVPSFANKMI